MPATLVAAVIVAEAKVVVPLFTVYSKSLLVVFQAYVQPLVPSVKTTLTTVPAAILLAPAVVASAADK